MESNTSVVTEPVDARGEEQINETEPTGSKPVEEGEKQGEPG